MKKSLIILFLLLPLCLHAQSDLFRIEGQIISTQSREPIPYASIAVVGMPQRGDGADSLGRFTIERVPAGIYRLRVSALGYQSTITPEYIISLSTPPLEIELAESPEQIESVVIERSLFERIAQSPVSQQRIGLQEIEKNPGANRDISRVVQSYPGVAFSPAGYRNDLIVRGGSPSENSFYIDGIEIPNINHFSTQGASGGPVGLVNADLIREVDLYTGAFPYSLSGALSAMLDISLRDGNSAEQRFKASVGASEISLSGSGHLSPRTTYVFSLRQSYLQLLFRALGLPFLPNFIDGLVKVRSKLSAKDELTVLALAAFDDMTLNSEGDSPTAEYILSYLPTIEQESFTVGAKWRHYTSERVHTIVLSHSYLNNRNTKYRANDASSPENFTLKLGSVEQKSTLSSRNKRYGEQWNWQYGADVSLNHFKINSFSRTAQAASIQYDSRLNFLTYGVYFGAEYSSLDERLTASVGGRLDGAGLNSRTAQPWRNPSPRLSLSYSLTPEIDVSASCGYYNQLLPLTSLGYREAESLVNRDLNYMSVLESTIGSAWRPRDELKFSLEGFYKEYYNLPLSVADGIPLLDKGAEYGTIGGEALTQQARGRAYGVELLARWRIAGRLSMVSSVTLYRSLYQATADEPYRPSAWDNRFIVNVSATYMFNQNWSVGAKLSAIGGAPYSPYDMSLSSLVVAWDVAGRAAKDYTRYNTLRLPAYGQLDMRVDKTFYLRGWSLGLYLDVQNIFASELRGEDIPLSTGIIEDETLPLEEQRYIIKRIPNVSGTLLPTVGITVEF